MSSDAGRGLPAAAAGRIKIQIFPLAADREALEHLCDTWFNRDIPAEIAYFRPAMPFVFCTVLSYDDMGPIMRWKTGVYSQHEVYFLVMLDHYRKVGGRKEFVEHAVTTPYIFVDDATSAVVGRESFGFPKEICRFSSGRPGSAVPWAPDATDYLTVETWQPTLSGRRLRPLMWIAQAPMLYDAGFDAARGRRVPPRTGLPTRSDLLWWAQVIFKEIRARSDPGPIAETPGAVAELLAAWNDGVTVNAYNVRQIPDPNNVETAFYQDLVGFKMKLRGIQNFRLFRERFGNAGYSVMINRLDYLPIAERLGLRAVERQRLEDADGGVIDVVEAISPMYLQADVVLQSSKRLCWRFERSRWFHQKGAFTDGTNDPASPPFNQYLGASSAVFLQEQPEPPVLELKYMMLPAATEVMAGYVHRLTPRDCDIKLEIPSAGGLTPIRLIWGQARERHENAAQHLVWMDGRYASVSVPVRYTYKGSTSQALLMLYDFADNPFAIHVGRTVYGSPTNQAEFTTTDTWFNSTQQIQIVRTLETSFLQRGLTEARHAVARLMDIVSDRREEALAVPARAELATLREKFGHLIFSIRPILTFGGIPDPADATRFIQRRVTLTKISSQAVVPPAQASHDTAYWVRIRATGTYDLVRKLGLENQDPPSVGLTSDGFSGAVVAVPVAGVVVSAERVILDSIEILWNHKQPTEDYREGR